MRSCVIALAIVVPGCAIDAPDLTEATTEVRSVNKLGANKLGANKLGANKLGANKLAVSALPSSGALIDSSDGREVLSYIVGCALPAGAELVVTGSNGTVSHFAGEFGLAPAWATRAPTSSERRWVSACVYARTNYYGESVRISMRGSHAALATTAAERTGYTMDEAGFYGDLFASPPTMYACQSHRNYNEAAAAAQLRKCAETHDNATTWCGFAFTGWCHSGSECTTTTAPYAGCHVTWGTGSPTVSEVVTVYLEPS